VSRSRGTRQGLPVSTAGGHEQAGATVRRRRPPMIIAAGLIGIGALLVLIPVDGSDAGRSCGNAPSVVAAIGLDTAAEGDGGWCRLQARSRVAVGMLVLVLPGALLLRWQLRTAQHAETQGPEYVLTDPAGLLIAVVRPVVGTRVDVPPWGRTWGRCSAVIGPPGEVPALCVVHAAGVVCVAPGTVLGMVRPGVGSRLRFSCGSQKGQMQRVSLRNDTWKVVDASGSELARITSRSFFSSAATTLTERDARALSRLTKSTREYFSSRPTACEVVESGPRLDWNEHGVLIGLAALCDHRVRSRTFPPTP
jgi:hypothetical protein